MGGINQILSLQPDARIDIWLRYLNLDGPVEFLLGHGVGTADRIVFNTFQFGVDQPESFLLKLYYEIGLIGCALFSAVYFAAIKSAGRHNRKMVPIFYGFLTNLIFVPVFAGLPISFFFSAFLARYLTRHANERVPTGVPNMWNEKGGGPMPHKPDREEYTRNGAQKRFL